jgi:hypothetical protein
MRNALTLPTALLLAPLAASRAADRADRVLVGVNYFAGWWEPLPNKRHDPVDGSDWRRRYPDRVPLLGEFSTQATMDREIEAAADYGVAFFSILWYHIPPGVDYEKNIRSVNAGLEHFLASPKARRIRFVVELCNHPPFVIKSGDDWANCIRVLLPAFQHTSYLRVGGKLVFKVHSAHHFALDSGNDPVRQKERLDRLRGAVREAGLGEMLIGGGVMGGSAIQRDWPAARLFDFTNTYMDVPKLELKAEDYPYEQLARAVRQWNAQQARSALPYVPFVAAGFNARPWRDKRPAFAFPTREEFGAELRRVIADFEAHPNFGLPLPDGGRQKMLTIYAWNGFGEGGIVAPTRGDNYSKLEAIRDLFPNKCETSSSRQP